MPIRILLELQCDLLVESKPIPDDSSGPLVWFFANQGDEWRLYGCVAEMLDGGVPRRTGAMIYVSRQINNLVPI